MFFWFVSILGSPPNPHLHLNTASHFLTTFLHPGPRALCFTQMNPWCYDSLINEKVEGWGQGGKRGNVANSRHCYNGGNHLFFTCKIQLLMGFLRVNHVYQKDSSTYTKLFNMIERCVNGFCKCIHFQALRTQYVIKLMSTVFN